MKNKTKPQAQFEEMLQPKQFYLKTLFCFLSTVKMFAILKQTKKNRFNSLATEDFKAPKEKSN